MPSKCYTSVNMLIFLAAFKKMYSQEKVRMMKAFEKQEKQLKEMKAAGKSTKQAVRFCGCLLLSAL